MPILVIVSTREGDGLVDVNIPTGSNSKGEGACITAVIFCNGLIDVYVTGLRTGGSCRQDGDVIAIQIILDIGMIDGGIICVRSKGIGVRCAYINPSSVGGGAGSNPDVGMPGGTGDQVATLSGTAAISRPTTSLRLWPASASRARELTFQP